MFNSRTATRSILILTALSMILLLGMKFVEIGPYYRRDYFCLTCPHLPKSNILRGVEVVCNFNIFVLLDVATIFSIFFLFFVERYEEYANFLFIVHVLRFTWNGTIFYTTDFMGKVLRPILKESCGLGGMCSDSAIQSSHTNLGLVYMVFVALMFTSCVITCLLMYNSRTIYQPLSTPVIMRPPAYLMRSRPIERLDPSSKTAPNSSRSPSPPNFNIHIVVPHPPRKYHRLSSSNTNIPRHSKNKVVPLTLPLPTIQQQIHV
ncbi:unnamed protein product [Caenorhabditis brenneri]